MSVKTKLIGDLGELVTTFCLMKEYKDIPIEWIGAENAPCDIEIPFSYGDTFKKPTAMTVMTRDSKAIHAPSTLTLTKERIEKIQADLGGKGWEYWLGLVLYDFASHKFKFKVHLFPTNILTDEDYDKEKNNEIKIGRIIEKSGKDKRMLTYSSDKY